MAKVSKDLFRSSSAALLWTADQAQVAWEQGLEVCIFPIEVASKDDITQLHMLCPGIALGIQNIHCVEQIGSSVDFGADFVILQSFDLQLIQYAQKRGIFVIPTLHTDEEATVSQMLGIGAVAFDIATELMPDFPKLLGRLITNMTVLMIGNAASLALDGFFALRNTVWVQKGVQSPDTSLNEVRHLAHTAVCQMLNFQLAHVGMNFDCPDEARETAEFLGSLFCQPVLSGDASFFAGTMFECVKAPYLGEKGHIGILTDNIEWAEAFLSKKGIEFNNASRQYDTTGRLRAVYFKKDIAGFVLHLLQRKSTYEFVQQRGNIE